MSKRARDIRAATRRDDRYVEGRAMPDDFYAAVLGWNKARSRSLRKFERSAGELHMTTDEYENWLFFGLYKPLAPKGRKP